MVHARASSGAPRARLSGTAKGLLPRPFRVSRGADTAADTMPRARGRTPFHGPAKAPRARPFRAGVQLEHEAPLAALAVAEHLTGRNLRPRGRARGPALASVAVTPGQVSRFHVKLHPHTCAQVARV